MKRTELRRLSPLRSYSTLRRGRPLAAVSAKRARENRQRTAMLRPLREAQPWCACCGVTGVGLDAHEVRSRARGGSITDRANIRLVCRVCHDRITSEPAWAEANGWAA